MPDYGGTRAPFPFYCASWIALVLDAEVVCATISVPIAILHPEVLLVNLESKLTISI